MFHIKPLGPQGSWDLTLVHLSMVLLLNWQISWVILYEKIQRMYLLPGLTVQRMSTYRAGSTEKN